MAHSLQQTRVYPDQRKQLTDPLPPPFPPLLHERFPAKLAPFHLSEVETENDDGRETHLRASRRIQSVEARGLNVKVVAESRA